MRIKAALSSDKRQPRCRGKTSSIPPVFRQKSGKCWAKHLKPCPLCQGCSHPRGSATSVLCLPRQLLCLFSFSLWEEIFFFTLHEVLPSEMLICSLVHLRWVGLQDRRVSLNSTKAKHCQQPRGACLWQSRRQHRRLFPAGFFGVHWEEFTLWFRGLSTIRWAGAVFKVQSIGKGEQWILRANTVRDQSEHPS